VTAAPDSAQLLMKHLCQRAQQHTRLDAHGNACFLPDFDPGALETLVRWL